MAAGLLVYDLLFVAVASALYGGAAALAAEVHRRLSPVIGWSFALFPSFLVGLTALVVAVGVLSALCPRPRPGTHAMMKSASFWGWLLRSLLRRVLFAPGLRWFLFSSNVLRFLALRALGARVAFTANMSTDVDLLDPWLLEVEPGATIGARSLLSGHFVEGGKLVLGEIKVERGALLAAEVLVGPDVVVGAGAVVKSRTALAVGVRVGARATVGGACNVERDVVIGERARIANALYVPVGLVVPAHARVRSAEDLAQLARDAETSASSATKSAAPDV